MMAERASHGRLWAHIKHIEMKNAIRDIKRQEGSLEEEKDRVAQVNEILKESKSLGGNPEYPSKIEDEFYLPYGLRYDDVIKKKADLVNDKKF